ncbi:MAG: hypothetical protein HC888_02830 [Candidatus Competibacteraceae bacterium]|nr:hypothetical protein [Candidatus Competibacteraceae bacterium]
MPVISLGSEWVELDITNGWLQNRGPSTIECTDAISSMQVSYSLLSAGQKISYADWSLGTIFVRKSQTSSEAKALVVANSNSTNELAEINTRVYEGVGQYLSDPTDLLHYWSCRNISRNSGLLGVTLRRSLDGVEADFGFALNGFFDRAAVLTWAGVSAVTVVRLYGIGAGTANAVQTTAANQPPLDLAANPLRIAASVDKSLVATLPSAIADAQIIALQDHGVTYDRRLVPSVDPYLVQSGQPFKERLILAGDTPPADVKKVMINIRESWKNPRAMMAYPGIGAAIGGGFYMGAAWDTVTTSPSTLTIGIGSHTLAISSGTSLPLYAGQWITLAPADNTTQVFMRGAMTSVTDSAVKVVVDSVTGSGSFTNWVIAAPWKAILASKVGGESTVSMQYKTTDTADPVECKTLTNGRSATAAMIAANVAAGSIVYPAADFIKSVNDAALSGYEDWEFPARDWLELMWRSLKPVTLDNFVASRPKSNTYFSDANTDDILNEPRGLNRHSVPPRGGYTATDPQQTSLAVFQSGGGQAPPWEVRFWSSSEYSATNAWSQNYVTSSPGAQSAALNKSSYYRVRAVRREILEAI